MDIDAFLATHGPTWDRLAHLVSRSRRGLRRLGATELEELVRLYQRVSTHLSQARTAYGDPALVARLTGLVAAAGAVVYGSRPRTLSAVGRFVGVTFPAAVWAGRRFVAVSAVLLLAPAAAMGLWLASSPRAVDAAAPDAVRQAYVAEDFEDYYSSGPAAQFASEVFTNNVRVAVGAFAVGVLACVPTALILAFNGGSLGVAAGLFAAAGRSGRFWGLILPHGLLELTAVVIAGAAGLALGWALIAPGDRSRREALAEEGRRSVVVVLGLVVAFALAGAIEGFVTGRPWPTAVRVGIGVAIWAAFVAYLWVRGRAAALAGFTGVLGEGETGAGRAVRRPAPGSASAPARAGTMAAGAGVEVGSGLVQARTGYYVVVDVGSSPDIESRSLGGGNGLMVAMPQAVVVLTGTLEAPSSAGSRSIPRRLASTSRAGTTWWS